MEMTQGQKRFFYEEGYVKIPGAVPRIMVDRARQAINAEIGRGNPKPFRPTEAPEMLNLFNETPVFSLLESAMGKGNLAHPTNVSVTLNYPQAPSAPHKPGPPKWDLAFLVLTWMVSCQQAKSRSAQSTARRTNATCASRHSLSSISTMSWCPTAAIIRYGQNLIASLKPTS